MLGCRQQDASSKPGAAASAPSVTIQVVAIEAKQQPISESVTLVGSVAPNEYVEIKAEIDGTVREIAFQEGQHLDKGQLLVALDETKLQASLNQAEANLKLSQATYDRSQQLLREKLISQQEYDQNVATHSVNDAAVALMRRNLRDARILAPFDGVAGSRQISPGQVISRNTTLTSLIDLQSVKVEVNVPERYLSQVQVGQKIRFSVAAFPGEVFEGDVYFISPQLDSGTRTALVKARVQNPQSKLRGGMFASLGLSLKLRESALVIPEPALMSNGDRVNVFVVKPDRTVEIRPIVVGLRIAGKAEVTKGLNPGEQVVVEGIQKLAPGMSVKFAPPKASAPYMND